MLNYKKMIIIKNKKKWKSLLLKNDFSLRRVKYVHTSRYDEYFNLKKTKETYTHQVSNHQRST